MCLRNRRTASSSFSPSRAWMLSSKSEAVRRCLATNYHQKGFIIWELVPTFDIPPPKTKVPPDSSSMLSSARQPVEPVGRAGAVDWQQALVRKTFHIHTLSFAFSFSCLLHFAFPVFFRFTILPFWLCPDDFVCFSLMNSQTSSLFQLLIKIHQNW